MDDATYAGPAPSVGSAPAPLGEGFRVAMRSLAKGVVIVTARDDRGRHAMAATAMTPLTLDPPSVLLCVNQSASIAPALQEGASIAVSLLSEAQADLSAACSGVEKGEARFAHAAWREDASEVPVLDSALAAVSCRIARRSDYGTHHIIIADVVEVRRLSDARPLIHFDGGYRRLSAEAPLQ
jgi:flavin reductase (DIM6/NTAB) family NADH-FMN oxidoreductase RutF